MLLMQVDEATAALRRIPLHLVDATDGITPETGEAAGQPQLSKNGAAFANTSATLTATANGFYYVVLTAGEVDTIGINIVRYKTANTAEFQIVFQVVSFDPYAATNMGMTALPTANPAANGGLPTVDASNKVAGVSGNVDGSVASVTGNVGGNVTGSVGDLAAAAVNKIWDDLTSGITQAGSIGKLLVDNVDAQVSLCALEATVAALNDLSAAQVNTEVDNALDTALPGSPTANSINEYVKKLSGAAMAGTETAGSLYRVFYDLFNALASRTNNSDLNSLLGIADTAGLTMLTELQQYWVIIGVAQTGTVWHFRAHLELNGQTITSGCTNGTLDAYDENSAQIGIQQTDAAPDAQHCFVFSITDTPTADRPHYVDVGIDYGGETYATRLQMATAD